MSVKKGRCLCGAVTYEYSGPENWSGYCHCESCRRNTGTPVVAWFGVPYAAFRYTGKRPKTYVSSPGARRSFCPDCGTPMAFEHERYPDEIHLYACSLEDPAAYVPSFHVHYAERVPWLEIADDLRRFPHRGGG